MGRALNETRPMRSRGSARLSIFSRPDLPPLIVTLNLSNRCASAGTSQPARKTFSEQFGLSFADASQLTAERSLADYYEAAVERAAETHADANWIRSELLRELENAGLTVGKSPVPAAELGALCASSMKERSGQTGQSLTEMFASGKRPQPSSQNAAGQDQRYRETIAIDEVIAASRTSWNSIRAKRLVRIFWNR